MDISEFIESCEVDADVFALRPDYRVELIAASGIGSSGHETTVEELLSSVEKERQESLAVESVAEIPHLQAWRETYSSFGAKPSAYRNSAEALIRRVPKGLPRVNPLTDLYNALSVKFAVPIGGEDLAKYSGPARLVRAQGDEEFETSSEGESVMEYPPTGEVVWRDDVGITCRRWNWRQSRRTALTESSRDALFILDLLEPFSQEESDLLVGELREWLTTLGADQITHRQITSSVR